MPRSLIVINNVEKHAINLDYPSYNNLQQVCFDKPHPRDNELAQPSFTAPFAYKIDST